MRVDTEPVIRQLQTMTAKIRDRLDDPDVRLSATDRNILRGRISGLQSAIHLLDDTEPVHIPVKEGIRVIRARIRAEQAGRK